MQSLSLDRNDPNAFILVADGADREYKPENDQVWALILDCADPQPFILNTTYGLRAKSMRLFPNFILNNQRISNAGDFTQLPQVTFYSPSSVQIKANYQNQANFLLTCYLPEPNVLLGSIQSQNLKNETLALTLQLALNLVPMGKGQPSHPEKSGNNQFLTGKTDNLEPVLFMTGGPTAISNPFPALSILLTIDPLDSQEISWALVSQETMGGSLEKAKQIITSNWQDEFQAHKMRHASQIITIKTGNSDWDAAFYLAQVNAATHLINNGKDFIATRLPDGSSFSREKQTLPEPLSNLDLYHLCQVMLPSQASDLQKLLEKQAAKRIDNRNNNPEEDNLPIKKVKIGCPLLAGIALELYEYTHDRDFLKQVYPNLSQTFHEWTVDPQSGEKEQQIVWENAKQRQIDSGLFTFDLWDPYSKGLDIKKAESPALYAMLCKETKALYRISKLLGERSGQRFYHYWQKEISKRLEACWEDGQETFGYQDIETHLCPSRELFYQDSVKSQVELNKNFTQPQRLQCHITTSDEHTRSCTIKFTGQNTNGDPIEEVFKSPNILWVFGRAHLTTNNLFKCVNSISFEGCQPDDHFIVETADFSQGDITCLLPLWAGAGNQEHRQRLVSKWLDPQDPAYAYGIPETWLCQHPLPEDLPMRINLLWNTLIIDGLVNQGEISKAADLFYNLMTVTVNGLKDYDGFYGLYEAENGRPVGQVNTITGLTPMATMLKIAGIKVLSPTRVALWGHNPFSWPIEIHWRGLSAIKEQDQTTITFPNGATIQQISEKPVVLTSDTE